MINLTAIIITSIICLTALAGGQIAYKALLVQLEIRKEENKPGPSELQSLLRVMRALFGNRPEVEKKEEPKNDE